jgi:hypothetical protein
MRRIQAIVIIGVLLPMLSVLRFDLPDCSVLSADSGWTGTYGGVDDDWASSVVETSDGGYALAGASCSFSVSSLADSYLVKTDASGIMQWNRTYGEGYDDGFASIVQTSDGGYAMAGYAAGTTDDGYFVKTDSSGNTQWSRIFRGSGDEFLNCVVQTGDGGYALAGQTDSFSGGLFYDAYLIKMDSSGKTQWSKTYGGPWDDVASSVVQTSDGGYVLAGSCSFAAGVHGSWLVKTDSAGNHLWNKTYGGGSASSVILTNDGGYALAGGNRLIKTDGSGNVQWNRTYGGMDYVGVRSIIQTGDGGYALTGTTRCFGADNSDAWLAKTDGSGNTQWRKTYGGTQDEYIGSVVQTSDGGYALAGRTISFGSGDEDFYLVKTEPNPSPVHEVAITGMHSSKTVVGESYACRMDILVANRGDFVEALNVSAWVAAVPPAISIQNVSIVGLLPDETRTVAILWNTTDWAYGNYTISAYAEPVSGEINTTNNTCSDGWVVVTIPGDVDGDRDVDILDVVRITSIYASKLGDAIFKPNSDIDGDRAITILDVVLCTGHYGQK